MWPDFLPAYDAIDEPLQAARAARARRRPLSELVAELPEPTLVHRQVQCPWALKGTVMRVLNERLADRDVDLTDGIKLFTDRGWVQVLPDADEPVVHIYAEGETRRASDALEAELSAIVGEVDGGRGARRPKLKSQVEVDPSAAAALLCESRFRPPESKGHAVEALPDLAALSDEALRELIRELVEEEREVSYRRRILHGRIDILRAELVARLQNSGGKSILDEVDVDSLAGILAGKSQPPTER